MNISLLDYEINPNREVSDKLLENDNLQNTINNHFNTNLYQDVGDIWNKNNSQRQFYTMPNTKIPNETITSK